MSDEPQPSDRFTVGLRCTAYAGREGFGVEVRPPLDRLTNIRRLAAFGTFDLFTGTR